MGKEEYLLCFRYPNCRDLRYLLGSDNFIPRLAGYDVLGSRQFPPAGLGPTIWLAGSMSGLGMCQTEHEFTGRPRIWGCP